MWFAPSTNDRPWAKAVAHLRRDPRLARAIRIVGPCALRPRRDYFVVLCKAIFTQQISTRVAGVLFARFRGHFPRRRPTPGAVLKFFEEGGDEVTRACGLSRQKRAYLLDLSRHFLEGRIPTRRLPRLSDEQIVESLTQVKGIGRWTAEMFLIFVLNRPDVLPVDDLGLREGVRLLLGLKTRPTPAETMRLAEQWRPYRSVATWYVWRAAPTLGRREADGRDHAKKKLATPAKKRKPPAKARRSSQ